MRAGRGRGRVSGRGCVNAHSEEAMSSPICHPQLPPYSLTSNLVDLPDAQAKYSCIEVRADVSGIEIPEVTVHMSV